MPRTNKELSDRTRSALLAAARDRFATLGYEATSTVEVVSLAGTTRGALYHHFSDKRALFQAVYVEVEGEVAARMGSAVAALGKTDSLIAIQGALEAFLTACADRDVQQILLKDGLSVLGWERWLAVEAEHGLGQLVRMLKRAQRDKLIGAQDSVSVAHMILGGVMQAGLLIAGSDDTKLGQDRAITAMRSLVEGLRRQAPHDSD